MWRRVLATFSKGDIYLKRKNIIITMTSIISITLVSGFIFTSVTQAGDKGFSVVDFNQFPSVTADAIITEAPDNDRPDYTYIPPTFEDDNNEKPIDTTAPIFEEEPEEPFEPATEMDLEPSSITVLVNKEYALPKTYKPKELVIPDVFFNMTYYDERTLMRPEAAKALEKLFTAAKYDGHIFGAVSGYRSYDRQFQIFTTNIATKGKEYTLKYSAVPGTSEHQTGLTMDVSCKSIKYNLSSALADIPEGIWLGENAHRFGFIIRYPKGKEDITGYAYEPWHLRYVGRGLATYLYENELTLEEYYNYTPSEDFDFEALYADLINYIPEVTTIPVGGEGVIIGDNGEIIDVGLGDEIIPGEGDEAKDPTQEVDDNEPSEGDDTDDDEDSDNDDTNDEEDSDNDDTNDEEDSDDDDATDGEDDGSSDSEEPGDITDITDIPSDENQTEDPDSEDGQGNADPGTEEPDPNESNEETPAEVSPTPVPTPTMTP
jgi:D-alanyl-D-alanine carboxypeptidase